MGSIKKIVTFLDSAVARITKWGTILSLLVLFVLLLARVIARATEIPFAAYDEIVELATVWMIIFGSVALWREGALYRVDVVTAPFPWIARVAEVIIQMLMLAFALMLVWVGGNFTLMSNEVTAFMQIDMLYYYGAIPAAGVVMAIYSAAALLRAGCAVLHRKVALPERPDRPLDDGAAVDHL